MLGDVVVVVEVEDRVGAVVVGDGTGAVVVAAVAAVVVVVVGEGLDRGTTTHDAVMDEIVPPLLALTRNTCGPTAKPAYLSGLAHVARFPSSVQRISEAPVFVQARVADVDVVGLGGTVTKATTVESRVARPRWLATRALACRTE